MSRARITTLTQLLAMSEGGAFTLPPEVLDSFATYRRVKALEVPQPVRLHLEDAAAGIVATTAAGETSDLVAVAAELDRATQADQTVDLAQRLLGRAIEQAADAAEAVTSEATEQIIVDHLRPALEQVHTEATSVAEALHGFDVHNPHALVTAPTKPRAAFAKLPELVAHRQAIFTAKRYANTIGYRKPEHDEQGMFGEFRRPGALFPEWKPPARMPQFLAPEDPVDRLLWVVSPAIAAAEPWLPTVAEQDQAWLEVFGPEVQRARQNRQNADGLRTVFGR